MPAVDAKQYNLSHFDNSDIWFKASNDQNVKTGWLGRWIDRKGNGTNPLQAISIDTALSKAIRTQTNPVCAIPSLPFNGFVYSSAQHRRRQQPQPQHDDARPVRVGRGRRERVPRPLARDVRSRGRDLAAAQRDHVGDPDADRDAAPAGDRLSERHARHAPEDRRDAVVGEPRHARDHDPLGRLRHAHGPDREPGQAADRVLARARGVPRRPASRRGSSSASRRSSSPSSGAASRRTEPGPRPAPTTAPAA